MSNLHFTCPRCGHLSPEDGVCPRGHGRLADLLDLSERQELEAIRDLYLPAGRHWTNLGLVAISTLLSTWGLAILGDVLATAGMRAAAFDFSFTASAGAVLGVAMVVLVLLLSPRLRQARALRRALAAVPPPQAQLQTSLDLPEEGGELLPPPPSAQLDPTDRESASRTRKRRAEADRRRSPKRTGAYSIS